MILYSLPKISSEIKIESYYLFLRERKKRNRPHSPQTHEPHASVGPSTWPKSETRAGATLLQKRPWSFPKLSRHPFTNSFSLWPLHLTHWPSSNFPTHTPGYPVHGGAASIGIGWPRRPLEAHTGPSVGPTSNYGLIAYAKRQCGATGLAGASCGDTRPSAMVAWLF